MMTRQEILIGIKQALQHSAGEYTELDIILGLENNTLTLLEFEAGFLIVGVEAYSQYRALKVYIAHGYIDETLPKVMSFLDGLARNLSCKMVLIEGRRGWARQLSQFGYAEQYVVVTKEVN